MKHQQLKEEYTVWEATQGSFRRGDRAFTQCRFAVGLLNPSWYQYMDLIPRHFGANWESSFKMLLFRLQLNKDDMWLPRTKNGPLAQEFLGMNKFVLDLSIIFAQIE